MVAEPNWWAGQTGPSKTKPIQEEPKREQTEPVPVEVKKNDSQTESKTFLSSDKSGHYVPDAYQKMLERMKKENPTVEPQKAEVLSRVAEEEKLRNQDKEQPMPKLVVKIGGSAKYLAKLRIALQSIIDGESSMYLVMPIRNLAKVEFKKAGKNKEGDAIYEVCEENVTLGYADHTIYS